MNNQLRNGPATPALILPTPAHTALETAPPQESEPHSVATIQDAADAEIKRIQKERRDLGTRRFECEQELMQLREKMFDPALSLEEMETMQQRESALDKLRVNALWRAEELQREFEKAGEARREVDDYREMYRRRAQDYRIAINNAHQAEQQAIHAQRLAVREREQTEAALREVEALLPQYGDVRISPPVESLPSNLKDMR